MKLSSTEAKGCVDVTAGAACVDRRKNVARNPKRFDRPARHQLAEPAPTLPESSSEKIMPIMPVCCFSGAARSGELGSAFSSFARVALGEHCAVDTMDAFGRFGFTTLAQCLFVAVPNSKGR